MDWQKFARIKRPVRVRLIMRFSSVMTTKMSKGTMIILMCSAVSILFLTGCASTAKQGNTLAFVDGEPVTDKDLEYALEVAHRREDLSSAGKLDISSYIQKLIDDRLIVQEARRMGVDTSPEVRQKVQESASACSNQATDAV